MATTQQSGFAPAASPLASTIVQTPDDAIVAGFTSIPSQGDNMPAYHARPKQSDGPLPVVIVVQEIFGVHEHICNQVNHLIPTRVLVKGGEITCKILK